MIHLRGQNGKTQCGMVNTPLIAVTGIPGFDRAHGTTPKNVCLKCLTKRRRIKFSGY